MWIIVNEFVTSSPFVELITKGVFIGSLKSFQAKTMKDFLGSNTTFMDSSRNYKIEVFVPPSQLQNVLSYIFIGVFPMKEKDTRFASLFTGLLTKTLLTFLPSGVFNVCNATATKMS